jgi:non-specific serine/threonine protein kinase/serine/threonine-protein kinase
MTASEIVALALAIDPPKRAGFVKQACAGDARLLAEAQALLDAQAAATATVTASLGDGVEGTIGPYKLIRQLGEGGMGVVYHAHQTQPLRRDVALKVIKPGMDSRQVIARFESERQALALMDHAHIARVFDAGTTPEGRPYFAMELVDGVPITRYCDSRRMTVDERIALFIPVCQAIQHAHQKGIIHRDIKPSNVLVADREGKPVAKVIDFGLAKALGQQLSDATMMTNVGMVVGTLEYMSPEQAELTRQDIDTRSDVYSLGAVLYELLTGSTPLAEAHSETTGYVDTLQRIREEQPKHPSVRVRGSAVSAAVAAARRSDVSKLRKLLHGELDWIVMKALEKDRARRYETVNALARDLERYLAGEAVEAGPPSAAYRLKKFAGRHRKGLAMAATIVVLLVAAVVVSTWMAVRASRAEAASTAVNDFLRDDVLAQAGAAAQARTSARPDPDLKVRTALDRAAARIRGKFTDQPLVEASIRQTIGNAYVELGLYNEAEPQLTRALELRRRALGDQHQDTAASMNTLAWSYERSGADAKAESLFSQALETRRRILGENHIDTLRSMMALGATYERLGKYAQGEALLLKTLAGEERLLGPDDPDTMSTRNNLIVVYSSQGKYGDAVPLAITLLESRRRLLGEQHPDTLTSMQNLAALYHIQHMYAQAEPLYLKAIDLSRRVLGEEHVTTLNEVSNLAELYADQGRFSESEALYVKALDIARRTLGEEHRRTIVASSGLAGMYADQGKYVQAESLFERAVAAGSHSLGKEHPRTLNAMAGLARVYRAQGKLVESESLYSTVLDARRRVQGAEHPETLSTLNDLADVSLRQRKYAAAESTARNALEGYEKARLDEWERYRSQSLLGASLANQNKFVEAEPLLLAGYDGMLQLKDTMPAGARPNIAQAGERIITLYQDWKRPDKVAEWRQRIASPSATAAR